MRYFFSNLFYRILQNILKIFSGYNLLWHLLAIVLTLVIVVSGFDWNYFLYVRAVSWRMDFFLALMLGSLLPILLPIVLLLIGKIIKNVKVTISGFAIAQAALLGLLVSDFYKALTGRIPPPGHFHDTAMAASSSLIDVSHGFQFGILRGGVFWGWPSSHTTVAFAMSLAAWKLFPKNKIIRTIAIIYAFYVGIGVSVTSIHWFSEFVAGAIIGSVVGITAGKSFFEKSMLPVAKVHSEQV